MVLSSTTNWCSMRVLNHQALQMSSIRPSKNFITSNWYTQIYSFLLLWSSNPAPLHVRYSIQQCWAVFACMSCSYENVSFHCKSRLCGRAVVSLTYNNNCSFLPWLLVIFIPTGQRVCKFANLHTSIVNLLQTLIYVNLRLRPPSTYLVGTTKNADCLILRPPKTQNSPDLNFEQPLYSKDSKLPSLPLWSTFSCKIHTSLPK